MVAKVVGLATGAFVASVGVWAFNEWRHVSDEDRLASVLLDHCLPFVQTGAAPFSDLGRSVGVYDGVTLNDGLNDGGARLIFENRFLAQWGQVAEGDYRARACLVDDMYRRADSTGFETPPAALRGWVAANILPNTGLVAQRVDLAPPPIVLSWVEDGADENAGLRLFLTGQSFGVSNVLVLDDLP